ncbi:glycosyl hydrolase family 88 [Marivirga lumbricoides]|uniref:Glycosyl hydrolase family 88 n=1 Tax=Marivirga lumbricoides TaxID=1046115 RepID=A0A2T4DU14_9BACT|nr:glycosyl hydrolase family 88 [Marivirga lumbricoides]
MHRVYSKITIFFLLTIFLMACSESKKAGNEAKAIEGDSISINGLNLAKEMATSEIKRVPDAQYLDFREKPKWEYTNGLVCSAMLKVWEATDDSLYFNYAKAYADSMINAQGQIKTYKLSDYNIDRVNPGKFLIELYKVTGKENYKLAIETLRNQMAEHPRTSEGGFWHKKRYPHQMWLDGLYMGSPFLAKYAKNYNEEALFDDVANQIYLIDKYAYDSISGLYYHGWDESREQDWADKETGLSPHFWGRSIGWFSMALVDVLEYFPLDHPKRGMIVNIANKLAQGILKYRDVNTGVWYQVVDMGDREGNYLEASASGMFAYFLLKGSNMGIFEPSLAEEAKQSFRDVTKEFVETNQDGTISLTSICAVAGLGGEPYRSGTYEYYVSEPQRDNDPKGVGPYIMAALEYHKLDKN